MDGARHVGEAAGVNTSAAMREQAGDERACLVCSLYVADAVVPVHGPVGEGVGGPTGVVDLSFQFHTLFSCCACALSCRPERTSGGFREGAVLDYDARVALVGFLHTPTATSLDRPAFWCLL